MLHKLKLKLIQKIERKRNTTMKFRFPVRFSKSKSLLLQSLGEIHPIEPEKNDMMFRFSFYLSEYYSV